MPDLTLLLAAGRLLLIGYATVATILTTACLALQAMTLLDRRVARRARRPARPLFVRLDPQTDAPR